MEVYNPTIKCGLAHSLVRWACAYMIVVSNHTQKERDRLGNVDKDGSIILKYITINITNIGCEFGLVLTDSG